MLGRGSEVGGGEGAEEGGGLCLTLHRRQHSDFYTKTSSNESHFNISLTLREKVTVTCSTKTQL